jgi:membrane-bound metal-dependent hydrolase YbcI (DUF457 family)
MPSPIGHAIAGVAVAWAADLIPGNRTGRTAPPSASWYRRAGNGLTIACGVLAAAPDLDLLFPGYPHRSITHSVTAVAVVAIVAALVAARKGRPVVRVASMCAAAWATHLLLDWTAVDRLFAPYGVQLFWPFSDTWFISGWDLFPGTERHNIFGADAIVTNAKSLATELIVLAPIALVLWLVRVKALAGFPSELAGRDHPPQ